MTANPHLGRPRIAADPVVAGPGVKGERSESHSDAEGALDARTGDHTMSAAGEAAQTDPPRSAAVPPVGVKVRTRYLSVAEAAAYLNVTERFVRGLVSERRVRFRRVGRFVRFDASDLDDFAETVEVAAGGSELADRVWWSARRLG